MKGEIKEFNTLPLASEGKDEYTHEQSIIEAYHERKLLTGNILKCILDTPFIMFPDELCGILEEIKWIVQDTNVSARVFFQEHYVVDGTYDRR